MESIKEKGKGQKVNERSQFHPDTQLTMAVLLAWVLLAISAVSSSSILPRAIQEPDVRAVDLSGGWTELHDHHR